MDSKKNIDTVINFFQIIHVHLIAKIPSKQFISRSVSIIYTSININIMKRCSVLNYRQDNNEGQMIWKLKCYNETNKI